MNGSLITSVTINFILALLLIILILFYVTNTKTTTIVQSQSQVCPYIDNTSRNNPPFQTQRPYVLKTLSGLYVQSCFECLPTPVSCFHQGIVASEEWNGDTIELVSSGNMYLMKLNSKNNPTGTYYLNMVRVNENYILCMTQNSSQPTAMFQIISYINTTQGSSNLYQIGTPISGKLIGESQPSCLVSQGVSIEDGYNMSVNAPNGMDEKSFFLLLPK